MSRQVLSLKRWIVIASVSVLIACGNKPTGDGSGTPDSGSEPTVDASPDPTPDASMGNPACVFSPTGQFNPELECSWDAPAAGSPYPTMDDVVSTPIVVNLTDDNGDGQVNLNDVPDIAFITYVRQGGGPCPPGATCGCCNSSGVLRVVSGRCEDGTLSEHFTIGEDEIEGDLGINGIWLDSSGGLAAGDIDSDGSVDIVATTQFGGTIAFTREGKVKWYQPDYPAAGDHLAGTQPAIADLDSDGDPEVIQGRVVLNGEDGSLQWNGMEGVGTNGFMGPVTAIGDVDLDGSLNILAGPTNYHADGVPRWTYPYNIPIDNSNCSSGGFPCDGFTAVGNFDGDDFGEVVIVRAGVVYLLNHDGLPVDFGGMPVEITIPRVDCALNEGGPPTVADFDGDGDPEIGVAGSDYYIVADLECLATPLPVYCSDPGIRWKVRNDDCSSRVTGSSVFDFDGDGQAEVVYNDEVEFRIMSGVDGAVRLTLPNFSHTRLEMPIVVDADNDGNAEIVYVENASRGGVTQGVRVWGDATDSWVPTRRIWNQHAYHVTNVTELGAIPQTEPVNWLTETEATVSGVMNNFRQNLPDSNALGAPDLTVELGFDEATCALRATVCNNGSIVVGAGIEATFYDNFDQSEILCQNAPVRTTGSLNPGECEQVLCLVPEGLKGSVNTRVCVDNAGYDCASGMIGGNNECTEDNNLDEATLDIDCSPID